MTRRICEVEWCSRHAQKNKKLCATHLGLHDPTPEHHVAAERTCLRCGESFESTWAGDRICKACRHRDYWNEKDAIRRGITPGTYDSPFEPDVVPGIAG